MKNNQSTTQSTTHNANPARFEELDLDLLSQVHAGNFFSLLNYWMATPSRRKYLPKVMKAYNDMYLINTLFPPRRRWQKASTAAQGSVEELRRRTRRRTTKNWILWNLKGPPVAAVSPRGNGGRGRFPYSRENQYLNIGKGYFLFLFFFRLACFVALVTWHPRQPLVYTVRGNKSVQFKNSEVQKA